MKPPFGQTLTGGFQDMKVSRPIMPRRVVVARGGAISSSSGLGRAHSDMINSLSNGDIENYQLSKVIEHDPRGNGLLRLWRRWYSHPSRVAKFCKSGKAAILHISDQEQAGLVPKNSPIPVVVTVHDLFHLDPQIVETPEGPITVGNTSTGLIRKRDIGKIRKGLSRANLLICDSETTKEHAQRLFPKVHSVTVPLGLDVELRDPRKNPMPRPDCLPTSKVNLLVIGSEEPRKRLRFVIDIIASLPDEIRSEIILHKVGAESNSSARKELESHSVNLGVEMNWLGSLDELDLIAIEQHADALLFPSVAEGFGYPPLEAMAAGCPVLMSDLGSHNELGIPEFILPPFDKKAWVAALREMHDAWLTNGKVPREINQEALDRAIQFSSKVFSNNLKITYDTQFS